MWSAAAMPPLWVVGSGLRGCEVTRVTARAWETVSNHRMADLIVRRFLREAADYKSAVQVHRATA